jgi:type I restriction enzyme S subunit
MNAALLLEHYARIADAPDAIARLRRFILDLAVRGKLVEQDAEDEPASDLLNRIFSERARLEKAGEAQKRKEVSPASEDASFDLPQTWRWTRLGSITSYIQRGKSPKYAEVDGVPVISQKCIQWSGLNIAAARLITSQSLSTYEKIRFLRDGDLLWNSTGTGTIGRIVKIEHPPKNLVCDSHVTVVRCLEINPEYVRTWLRSDHVYGGIEGRAAGSTNQVELTAQMAVSQGVPLPPLAEQRRIVAKVDELMALCDHLEAAHAEREHSRDRFVLSTLAKLNEPDPETFKADARFALANLAPLTTRADQIKQLRQTILNLAVRGNLVEQDPNNEPAIEQLRRIGRAKSASQKAKQATRDAKGRPDAPDCAEHLPSGWARSTLGELALSMRYGTSIKCERDVKGAAVLRIPNVSTGAIDLDDLKYGPLSEKEQADLALEAGDLLMIRSNGSLAIVGRSAVVTPEAAGMSFAGYLVRVRLLREEINPSFLWLSLNGTATRDAIEIPIRSAVGLKNVNLTEFGALKVLLPPFREQNRIVAKVDELMALCDQLEASITTSEQTRARLLEAVLHKSLEPA